MSLATLLLAIALVIIVGITLYLWSDNKDLKNDLSSSTILCSQLNVEHKELKSLFDELDEENVQLTVKCNQYEALLKTRLDDIPVADVYFSAEVAYPSCRGEKCRTCEIECCPSRLDDIPANKPCCTCENGVYDPAECIGCTEANGYENYEPMKYE